ncbi:hypothetical protein MTO96_022783 [Rhipicephalus appendiculatus]
MRAQNLDPYRVAPERHASTDDSSSDESDGRPPPLAARLENADWCKNCIVMPTAVECVCCWDYAEINRDFACITMEPYFRTMCLDAIVLRVQGEREAQVSGESKDEGVSGQTKEALVV